MATRQILIILKDVCVCVCAPGTETELCVFLLSSRCVVYVVCLTLRLYEPYAATTGSRLTTP